MSRLLDRRGIARELGITLSGAERVMRHCPLVRIGRRVYVDRRDVDRFIEDQRRGATR